MTTIDDGTRGDLPGEIRSLVDWLVDGARTVHAPQAVLAELCRRLVGAGLPLHRVAVFVRTLHPNVIGRRFLWRQGAAVEVADRPHGLLEEPSYTDSPIARVFGGQGTIRRRLADPGCPNDFGILEELRAEGVSDYLVQPLAFSNGEIHAVSWTTTAAGGFSDADLEALGAIQAPLARLTEVYGLRRVATTLLDTYVGHGAGERILQGQIRRGDIERIGAVLLLSDLRGFTAESDRLPGEQVIGLLNAYFDGLVPAIEAQGGEILKFIGDGLLAIFPVAADPARASAAALAAVAAARTALAEANAARQARAEPALRYGLALHLGEVLYGNVGSASRLDFTATGPAVNLTARLETLARDLGRELVLSAAFAAHCPDAVRSLGRFELRGFREPQEVFTLR
jgi:adenylate cyclase